MFSNIPEKQGLYNPAYEHDACGMGFVANVKGKSSHKILTQALEVLINLKHRGATGSEKDTGDGAGILFQIPDRFFKKEAKRLNFNLPEKGDYSVGMVFLPFEKKRQKKYKDILEETVKNEGFRVAGWRDVPVNEEGIGKEALSCRPDIKQIFIEKSSDISRGIGFERKLYIIRKKTENRIKKLGIVDDLYLASLSSRTIVYKGMLMPEQIITFFPDLNNSDIQTAMALVHSRFSTNTFPSWERAHPNRYLIHNGEINTLRGNINWMNARQALLESDLFGDDLEDILPIINSDGSDSAIFDNVLEFLSLTGRSLPHAMMMMIPEPWDKHEDMDKRKKAFYEYHSCLMEPWDGPAAMVFTDGLKVGAVLDRNGLRPSRYYLTDDDMVILSSEVGVLNFPQEKIISKKRLQPGKMLLVDTERGKIINDKELKEEIASQEPYQEWLDKYLLDIEDIPELTQKSQNNFEDILLKQKAFGYSYEDINKILIPMAKETKDPIGAMGNDTPLAVLSDEAQLLYNYFKQLFAQVTNPPIDSIREEIVTATKTVIGSEGNLINPKPESCRQISFKSPVISNKELNKLKKMDISGFKTAEISILFEVENNKGCLEEKMNKIFNRADSLIDQGNNILILSDRGINKEKAAVPALLALAGLHHHLIRNGKRTELSLILETGEAREVHHFSLLLGYGADLINPYLAYESIVDLISRSILEDIDYDKAINNYMKAANKGIVKVMAKMGISTVQSYRGAQIFEALGLNTSFIDKYFTGTASRIGGIGIKEITKETLIRHNKAFISNFAIKNVLDSGSKYSWRKDGEEHLYNPESIYLLQRACREGDYTLFKKYSALINDQSRKALTLRGQMKLKYRENFIPLKEVESVESIVKRFKTGAMSYGSISKETHETLAIAMNRIGAKSNTGEGGEDPARYEEDENGDRRLSAIKQVASGRFGVNSHYLTNSLEIQIKMAQGAKPGEGGQLPGKKVYPWIADARGTTPGIGLISPPPHHDIYSIEDLAQLIYDLKNANREARINVKLVSEVGVGTIAAGVAKGKADVILISAYDGGTGASPRTSISHTGLPWELGLAETHQTLVLNNLRSRVRLETDGKLMTGRDVIIAALLGAEEYGFATAPLVSLGCVMMRVCNLDTCPVGIATQNPELRKRFAGKPEYPVNLMYFIAQEMREEMAKMGFRTVKEMIGRVDRIKKDDSFRHWKASKLDYKNILYKIDSKDGEAAHYQLKQEYSLDESFDFKELINRVSPALDFKENVELNFKIKNTDRTVGTIMGNEVTKRYGEKGLNEDTIKVNFKGSAGQSFAAFIPKGITMILEGDGNDYLGKGLSGGKVIVKTPENSKCKADENIIIGNVALFGATSGEAYIQGIAGERFCVRNSGVDAVVEGVGDHACEYMTGGHVLIIGETGRNFAAGMSGGIAYVLDMKGDFASKCNRVMVDLESLDKEKDIIFVKEGLEKHNNYTFSKKAREILDNWDDFKNKFIKVIPRNYKKVIEEGISLWGKQGHF